MQHFSSYENFSYCKKLWLSQAYMLPRDPKLAIAALGDHRELSVAAAIGVELGLDLD